jgi:hypothetical protein
MIVRTSTGAAGLGCSIAQVRRRISTVGAPVLRLSPPHYRKDDGEDDDDDDYGPQDSHMGSVHFGDFAVKTPRRDHGRHKTTARLSQTTSEDVPVRWA